MKTGEVHRQLSSIYYFPLRDCIILLTDEPSSTNAFLSPRWGGILVYNVANPPENVTYPHAVTLDMRLVMEVFVSQLRLLIGINPQVCHNCQCCVTNLGSIILCYCISEGPAMRVFIVFPISPSVLLFIVFLKSRCFWCVFAPLILQKTAKLHTLKMTQILPQMLAQFKKKLQS